MTLAEKTTHATEAKDKLITQFKGLSEFEGLLDSYMAQIQELEGVLFDLLAIVTDLDSQDGAQLDLVGTVVGQAREGRADAAYLNAIKAKLVTNFASGTVDEMRTMLELIVTNDFTIEEYFPAALVVRLVDAFLGSGAEIASLITQIRAAGVRATLEYSTEDDVDTFQFASGDTAEASETEGFAPAFVDNADFDSWTADDPDGWVVTEIAPNALVTEVGLGEDHTGSGTGALCLYRAAGAPSTYVRIDQSITGLTIGATYTLQLVVSAFAGSYNVFIRDTANGDFWEAASGVGVCTFDFTPSATSINLAIYPATASQPVDITIDQITITNSGGPAGGVWTFVEEA
jgi:hypothetical protein